MGVQEGDTLNLQWAYLRDQPATGPVIGTASGIAPPLPWPSREAVLRRDAEVRAIREEMQGVRNSNVTRPAAGAHDSHKAVQTRMDGG
jgi:hypothetical protein